MLQSSISFRVCLIHFSVRSYPLTPDKIVVVQFTTPDLVADAKWKNGLKSAGIQQAKASVSGLGPIPKARSTIRASPRMSPVRLKMAACPLRKARMTSIP